MSLRSVAVAAFCWAGQQGTCALTSDPAQTPVSFQDTMLDHLIVVPEHRLLFCFVDGVQDKSFNKLFRAVRSRYDPEQLDGNNKELRNTYVKVGMGKQQFSNLFQDGTWHKAVFIRDPLERFVSTFNRVCTNHKPKAIQKCKDMFGEPPRSLAEAVNEFRPGMDFFANAKLDAKNSRLMLQTDFCGGLGANFRKYKTVVKMSSKTLRNDVDTLLTNAGIPRSSFQAPLVAYFPDENDPSVDLNQSLASYFPKQHAAWMVRTLLSHYRRDYQELGMTVPAWAQATLMKDGKPIPEWMTNQAPKNTGANASDATLGDVVTTVTIDDTSEKDSTTFAGANASDATPGDVVTIGDQAEKDGGEN